MKNLLLLLVLLTLSVSNVSAQSRNSAYERYINQYKGIAVEQMRKYGVPASITLAQAILESGAGNGELAQRSNNHFGIKRGSDWRGPVTKHTDDKVDEYFRVYNSVKDSYEDHSKFLHKERYQRLYRLSTLDYKGWARGLKAAGYATSPTYAEALIRVIEMYSLYQFDTGKYRQARPSTAPQTQEVDDFFLRHVVYKGNKCYFIIVEVGDDMATISQKTGISLRKLYKYNDLPRDYAPTAGDLIYLQKKRKCASKEFKKNPIHIVEVNQSLHDISQLYAIRLESLCKLNKWDEPHAVEVGEIIRIR